MKNFLYTCNSNYFNYMYISIYSLLENNNFPITIHIIEFNFTSEQILKLEKLFDLYPNASLKFYPFGLLKDSIDKISLPKWRGTDIANARLFAREILDVDKVLYIDSDTIIDSSLENVFSNIESPVNAVRELVIPNHMKPYLNEYYNSGVLLFDYKLWDELACDKLLFDTKNNIKFKLIYPDQDLLNLAFYGSIGTLDPKYNAYPLVYNMIRKHPKLTKKYFDRHDNFYEYNKLIDSYSNPCIYHLIDYVKSRPWIENRVHPFNDIYECYMNNSDIEIAKIKATSRLSSIEMLSLITILLQISFPEEYDVKGKIRKILYPKR